MYRLKEGAAEVLLIHPGGPYWTKKDDGAWSIPKGEIEEGEDTMRRGQTRIRGGDRLASRGAVSTAQARQTEERQDRLRVGLRGGLGIAGPQQPGFLNGMATPLRRAAGIPEVDRAGLVPHEMARKKIQADNWPFSKSSST